MKPTRSREEDPLGAALRLAKGMPRPSRSITHNTSIRKKNRSSRSNRNSPTFNHNNKNNLQGIKDPPICTFCESENAAICISRSLSKKNVPLCLVHYYTTRSCRIDPRKVCVINASNPDENNGIEDASNELKSQLPYVNDLFAEAFTELQKEIAAESARSFHEMSNLGSDPLSILQDRAGRGASRSGMEGGSRIRSQHSNSNLNHTSKKEGHHNDGGFMMHVQKREKDLESLQKQRIREQNNLLSNPDNHQFSDTFNQIQKKKEINPYKRRKISAKSSWHLILNDDYKSSDQQIPISSAPTEIFESKCTCGGNAIMFGNTISRNNDVHKAEIWGTKRENEISTRYQCQKCGKIWIEEE